ncbi:MAG TPA: acyl-CoA synthetase FdrA [Thermoanaerobaculia bacterium]|nr:acyl-CoA synthetase FdrA [Thermoanaerobaculia bacterium]
MSLPPVTRWAARHGAYHDSLVLMQLQASLGALPGVLDAAVVMAIPANLALLAASGLLPTEAAGAARADDLLVVVKAESEAAAGEALARVDPLLAERRPAAGTDPLAGFRPRSLAGAMRQLPAARWVLVSVAGRYAAAVAREALDLGRHVFLYSDNVSLAEEVALKREAQAKGLLVLGPDCGTALIGGAGLGFANRVRRGTVGLLGASGTGLQAVASQLHALGAGVSQALGTGGRDLTAEVGGATAHQALDLLRRDPRTEVIVLVGKPPAPPVAARLLTAALQAGKPVVVHFVGTPAPARRLGNLHFAATLSAAAETAVALLAAAHAPVPPAPAAGQAAADLLEAPVPSEPPAPPPAPGQRYLRGLFSGGTLAAAALQGLGALLAPIFSNLSSPAAERLGDPHQSRGHTLLDLGADELTVGRPHPMIDQDLLLRRLARESADPEVAAILLDVVLGDGAHPDPAGALAPAVSAARAGAAAAGRALAVGAIVVGTDQDPQGLAAQIDALASSGARVFRTVEEAVEWSCLYLTRIAERRPESEPPAVPLAAIEAPLAAVNVGLEAFHASLASQGAAAVQVAWRPPAGGDEKLAGLLGRLKQANQAG